MTLPPHLTIRPLPPAGPGFCEEFIDFPDDPWAGTYCKLLAGHAGPCSAHYPLAVDERQPDE